ncbi:MAG: hypothetical protein F4Z96_03995, partial [Chloroflexi bacterium]|nr:hypothetical protein [Chloroflexota bacterium]
MRDVHFSEAQLVQYRRLSEIFGDVNIATELLANAFTLSDPSLIEPLRERFEATITRINRNLPPLEGTAFHYESAAAFERLVGLGSGDDSVFDLFASELTITMRQEELLSQNRDVSLELNAEVTALISDAQAGVQEAT